MKSTKAQNAKTPPRRKQQKARRQEEILKAAFDVFAARGYEATRIDDVARRAGIAKGTIYLYFRDKERLFQAVVRNLIPKRFDVLVDSLPGPPEELLGLLALTVLRQRGEKAKKCHSFSACSWPKADDSPNLPRFTTGKSLFLE